MEIGTQNVKEVYHGDQDASICSFRAFIVSGRVGMLKQTVAVSTVVIMTVTRARDIYIARFIVQFFPQLVSLSMTNSLVTIPCILIALTAVAPTVSSRPVLPDSRHGGAGNINVLKERSYDGM